ncbi:MAG: carboxypeptidase-like regulatory domain-containing protein, partial [Isosphaeraceae bacterium]
MNRPRRYNLIVGLPLGFLMAGCTGLNRPDFGLRTTPSLGDRPLAVVNGRPGEDRIIRTETEASGTIANNDTRRISGRVIDHRGQPVAGATVRLADGALSGGQVSDVTTDEAGGFTIRGLRSSTPYTMIASLDLGGESRVGRARFLSGETQARILLEAESTASAGSARPGDVAPARPAVASREPAASPQQSPAANPKVPTGRWVYVVEDESGEAADSARFASAATRTSSTSSEKIARAAYIPEAEAEPENEPAEAPAPRRPAGKNTQWRPREKNDGVAQAEKRDNAIQRAQYSPEDEPNPLPPAIERKAYVYEEFQEEEPQPVRRVALAPRRPGVIASTGNINDDMLPIREIPAPAEEVLEAEAARQAPMARRQPARSSSSAQPRSSRDMTYVDYPSAANLRVEDIEEANRIRRAARSGQPPATNRYDEIASADPRRSTRWQEAQRDARPADPAPTDRTVSLANRSGNALMPPPDLPVDFSDRQPPVDSANPYGRGMERSANQRAEVERALNQAPASGVLAQIEPDVARTDQERIDRLKTSQNASDPAFNGDSPRTSNEWLNRMTGRLSAWTKPADAKAALGINSAFCDFDTANQRLL